MDTIRRIIRNGASNCVVIPPEMMDALLLSRGDRVLLRVENGAIIVTKIDLAQLMRRFRPSLPPDAASGEPS
jgi:antitoxin component of MazEF toxin-antitoxin module